MIVFPWLVAALVVIGLAILLASAPARYRYLRGGRRDPYARPAAAAIIGVAMILLALIVVWFLLAGPGD